MEKTTSVKSKRTLSPKVSAIQKPKPLPRGNGQKPSSPASASFKRKRPQLVQEEAEEEEDWEVVDDEPDASDSDEASEEEPGASYSDLEEEDPFVRHPKQKTKKKGFVAPHKKASPAAKKSSESSPQPPQKLVKTHSSWWDTIKQTTSKIPLFSEFQLYVSRLHLLFLLPPACHIN